MDSCQGKAELPSKKDLPILQMLDIPEYQLSQVPYFKPLGARKRLQSVIELICLEEENPLFLDEYGLDDLGAAEWSKCEYSEDTKVKVEDIVKAKDPDATFTENLGDVTVKLEDIKYAAISAEDSEEEADLILSVPNSKIVNSNGDRLSSGSATEEISDTSVLEVPVQNQTQLRMLYSANKEKSDEIIPMKARPFKELASMFRNQSEGFIPIKSSLSMTCIPIKSSLNKTRSIPMTKPIPSDGFVPVQPNSCKPSTFTCAEEDQLTFVSNMMPTRLNLCSSMTTRNHNTAKYSIRDTDSVFLPIKPKLD